MSFLEVYNKIVKSNPKKDQEEYSSSVSSSSYAPGDLTKATENHISDIGQSENVSTSGGVTRSVTQSVKKTTSVSSTRSSGYSSEEGKKDDEISSSSDVLNTRAILSSSDDIFASDKSKQSDQGFQYEDIQSFKERQKIEGDRLQMHRQSLTANIVGTGKHGAMSSDYGSHSSSYSNALDSKPKDGDGSVFTSRVDYKYSSDRKGSGDNLLSDKNVDSRFYSSSSSGYKSASNLESARGDPLSRENLLAEARGQNKEAFYKSSSSSDYITSSNRDSSRNDALTRAENLLSEARSRNRNHQLSNEYRYSAELSSSKEDLLGSNKDIISGSDSVSSSNAPSSVTTSSSESRYSRGLSNSKEDILGFLDEVPSSSSSDPLSRENLLAEARKQARDPPSSVHSSSSEFRYSSGLSNSKEDITGRDKDSYRSSIDDKLGTGSDAGASHDERYSRSDALVAKYLQSSRHKGLSKYGADLDSSSKSHYSPLKDIKEEDSMKRDNNSEVKHHSAGGRPMSYLSSTSYEDLLQKKRDEGRSGGDKSDYSKRLSGEIRDERKSRQDAIDRLLESTRRFKSSESLLDSSSSRDKTKETNFDNKPESSMYSSVNKDISEKTNLPRRDSAGAVTDSRYGRDDKGRYPRTTRDGVITREEQIRKYTETSNYETPYTSLDHTHRPTHYTPGIPGEGFHDRRQSNSSQPDSKGPDAIYDKLNRAADPGDKPRQEPGHPGSSVLDNRRGSTEGVLREPLYDHLNRRPLGSPGSPVPMTDRYSHPLDEYDKPIAVHGRPNDPGDRSIVSRRTDLKDYGISDFHTDRANVSQTTRTSISQRTFMSRDGEVIKDETSHLENVYHGGQNAIEGSERRESNPDLPTRIQRYPALRANDVPKDKNTSSSEYTKTTEEERTRRDVKVNDRTSEEKRDLPNNAKLDEILKMAGVKDSPGGTTKYQQQTRKDEVTRVGDDSNIRTRVHRTDVNTNVNIVKEIVKEKPKETKKKSGIAGLRSKIEALTKSVDELMNYKHKTLESYVHEHGERRPSQDILETLPKPEYYEVKSKRYEPNIKLDEVDYVHKEVEIPETPQKSEILHSDVSIEKMWMTEDQGTDVGIRIPKQINLISEEKKDWWNAPTAEEADRFLCIGDWQWWNANTTEGVDNILGIRAINKETGEAGAIIAKYQGEEKPIEWAWYQATQQPNLNERRRTLTRVLTVDRDNTDGDGWWDAPTAEDADKYLSLGHHKWWDQNAAEDVDKVLGVRGATEETGTVLATYRDGTKPTAWTWVETPEEPERPDEKTHLIRRSSRDLYIDETHPDNVELLIRVKDEETTTHQQPRFVAVRPGPVEKAIIIREIQTGELPQIENQDEVVIKGTEGEGLEIQDGVIKMKIKDMTPEERKAWVNIMGIERKGFKIDENETLEIPVRVVDRPHTPREEGPVYAVPDKRKKNVQRLKSTEPDGKPKSKEKKETASEKKKKQKEIDAERKKAKKLEEEKKKQIEKENLKKKKSEDKEKKKELESIKKKKELDSQKKKKEIESIKKKKELEKIKERESKKMKKEKSTKKSGSVTTSNEKTVAAAPPVDRSLKPKLSIPNDVVEETHVQHESSVRRSSDNVDSVPGSNFHRGSSKHLSHVEVNAVHPGSVKSTHTKSVTQVGGSTYSPNRKPGPFAISGKGGLSDRPQSTRARMTTQTESHNVQTVFDDKTVPTKKQSPSVKVVKRVDITKSEKGQRSGTGKPVEPRNKSGQIAVPLRGGSKHLGNMQVVASQRTQSQKAPGQIRQTRIEKTQKTYRTETKVVNPQDGSSVLAVQSGAPLPLERSISESQASVVRSDSVPFNSADLRRGSGHSVTNVSVKSRSSDGHPNVVQMNSRSSGDSESPLQRQGSSSNHSVTNVSVSSRSIDGQPSIVRRSSGDNVISAPLDRRRSSGHSVTNVSVSSRSSDGQNTVHKVRQSNGDSVKSAPLDRRRSSGHSVTNVSVSSRSSDGQNTVHKVRPSSIGSVPLDRQGSTRSVTNVSVDGVPLNRQGSEFHSVVRHTSSGQSGSNMAHMGRRPSGDPWKVDISERPGIAETHSKSNVSVVRTVTSSGQQAAGFPPPPDMAMLSGQQVAGFSPPPNMAMSTGQTGFSSPPNMAMSSGQQFNVIQNQGSVKSYGPIGRGDGNAVVQMQNQPAGSSSDVSYYTEGHQLPHGYVQKEVRHERKTEWSVDNVPK